MKISATLKNNRGGQKVTADDTRILVDLKLGNRLVGTICFYPIKDWISGEVLGYRILLDRDIIKEECSQKGKQRTGEYKELQCGHTDGVDDENQCIKCGCSTFIE